MFQVDRIAPSHTLGKSFPTFGEAIAYMHRVEEFLAGTGYTVETHYDIDDRVSSVESATDSFRLRLRKVA